MVRVTVRVLLELLRSLFLTLYVHSLSAIRRVDSGTMNPSSTVGIQQMIILK